MKWEERRKQIIECMINRPFTLKSKIANILKIKSSTFDRYCTRLKKENIIEYYRSINTKFKINRTYVAISQEAVVINGDSI